MGCCLDAEVIPAVDFSRLDEVAVVIEGARAGAGSRGGRAGSRERTVTLRTAGPLLAIAPDHLAVP